MLKIILVTHGHLAKEMLDTASQIIGKPTTDGFATFAVTTTASVQQEAEKLKKELANCPEGAVILTDIFGGSAEKVHTPAFQLKGEIVRDLPSD